jgi:hypothetical protein
MRASLGQRLGGAVVAEIELVQLDSARWGGEVDDARRVIASRCGSTSHGESLGGMTGRPHLGAQHASPPGSASWRLRSVRSRPSSLICVTPSWVQREARGGARGVRHIRSGDQDCSGGEFSARRPTDDMDISQTRADGAP